MYFISQLFISSRNTGLILCNNSVYVGSIVMIHKYGTTYPSLQQVNSLWFYPFISQVGGKDFATITHTHLLSGFIKRPSDSIIL